MNQSASGTASPEALARFKEARRNLENFKKWFKEQSEKKKKGEDSDLNSLPFLLSNADPSTSAGGEPFWLTMAKLALKMDEERADDDAAAEADADSKWDIARNSAPSADQLTMFAGPAAVAGVGGLALMSSGANAGQMQPPAIQPVQPGVGTAAMNALGVQSSPAVQGVGGPAGQAPTAEPSHVVYEKDKAAFWQAKGYDGKIFADDDLTDADLAKDASFLKAAAIVYADSKGDRAPMLTGAKLADWAIDHMRWKKQNFLFGTIGGALANAMGNDQAVKDAYKYIGDAYDHKSWDWKSKKGWKDFGKALLYNLADPTIIFGGAKVASIGIRAVKSLGLTGVKERGAEFVARTVAPAAALGAGFGATSGTAEAVTAYNADAHKLGWSTVGEAGIGAIYGAAAGGGLSVLGAGAVALAPQVSRAVSSTMRGPRAVVGSGWNNLKVKVLKTPDPVPSPVRGAEAMPAFHQRTDLGNHFLFRYKILKPHKWYDDYRALRVESAMTNPRPIIKPVVNYVDRSMEKFGLTKSLYDLDQDIRSAAQTASNMANLQTQMLTKMRDFANANRANLLQFKREVQALRDHVDSTYKVITNKDGTKPRNDGRFHGLIDTIVKDLDGKEKGHKTALLAYLDDMIKTADDLQKTDFGDLGQRVRTLEYKPGIALEDIHALQSHSLHKIFTMARDAHARLHVRETTTGEQGPHIPFTDIRILVPKRELQEVNGIKIAVTGEERESVIRQIATGHYEAEPNLRKRADPKNVEANVMDLELEYKKWIDPNDNSIVKWDVENTRVFATSLAAVVRDGYAHEALHVARRLMMRIGSNSRRVTIPPGITDNEHFVKALGDIVHTDAYKRWKKTFDAIVDRNYMTGKQEPGYGPTDSPGRASEEAAMERSYFWHYMFRFPALKPWAKPAEVKIQAVTWQNPWGRLHAYTVGGYTTPETDPGKLGFLKINRDWWWREKPKEGANILKDNFVARSPWWLKAPTRAALGGMTARPLLYPTVAAGVLVGGESAWNAARDQDKDTWVGDTGRWIGQKTLGTAEWIQSHTAGYLPYVGEYLDGSSIAWANEQLFRAEDDDASSPATEVPLDANGRRYAGPGVVQLPPGQPVTMTEIGLFNTTIAENEANVQRLNTQLTLANAQHKSAETMLEFAKKGNDKDQIARAKDREKATAQTVEGLEKSLNQTKADLEANKWGRTQAYIGYYTSADKIPDGNVRDLTAGNLAILYEQSKGKIDLSDTKYFEAAKAAAERGEPLKPKDVKAVLGKASKAGKADKGGSESSLDETWQQSAGRLRDSFGRRLSKDATEVFGDSPELEHFFNAAGGAIGAVGGFFKKAWNQKAGWLHALLGGFAAFVGAKLLLGQNSNQGFKGLISLAVVALGVIMGGAAIHRKRMEGEGVGQSASVDEEAMERFRTRSRDSAADEHTIEMPHTPRELGVTMAIDPEGTR
ncbi:MAG: hypothetical protein KDI46_01815, partial [Alphaproteobacteria bacterium]|nr:hypothetical protein [Alphaproteobacteria bacterium]